jgi:hypothetical protein
MRSHEHWPVAVGGKSLGAESRWLMGRVMPRELLDGVGEYLDLVAPDRKDELIAAARGTHLPDLARRR